MRLCACGCDTPIDGHPTRKWASDAHRKRKARADARAAKTPIEVHGPIADALEQALDAAGHLDSEHAGVVQAARKLARLVDGSEGEDMARWAGQLLKYLEALGLTPLARSKLGGVPPPGQPSKLAELRLIHGRKTPDE